VRFHCIFEIGFKKYGVIVENPLCGKIFGNKKFADPLLLFIYQPI